MPPPENLAASAEQDVTPFLESLLSDDLDDIAFVETLALLVDTAVAETLEMDAARRRARAARIEAAVAAEEAREAEERRQAGLAPSNADHGVGGTFDAIRTTIIRVATGKECSTIAQPNAGQESPIVPPATQPLSPDASPREGRPQASGLRSILNTLSPQSKSKELPPFGLPSDDASTSSAPLPPPPPPPILPTHTDCKSFKAVAALIAIFTRLTFPSHSASPGSRITRTPASSRSITIYRDLLNLLLPLQDDGRQAAKCPRARLLILQFLMRLRADREHRIYFRADVNRFVTPFAATLYRTKDTEPIIRSPADDERRRTRQSPALSSRPDEDRGRSSRSTAAEIRRRSRSRAALASAESPAYHPLWCLPETLPCEMPPDLRPSEGMTTYDPNHPSLRDKDAAPIEGVWLPVSEYVRVIYSLLQYEHDWELVSYVLCFLPLQLGNKYFFHGRRATMEVKALLQVLYNGITKPENRWEKRFQVPTLIKRPHINAAAYASLSILISYRDVFDRNECDQIVEALAAGLEGNAMLAKPCLQALTICIWELDKFVGKHLLSIIQRMTNILSTPAVAVHILEFIQALGQHVNLYRNFTDDQYRLVFAVAVGYISEHNARSDQPLDFNASREAFTLSQHVIGLAYETIYVWFKALHVAQRPRLVGEIVRGLLSAKSQRAPMDERAEVAFDWMARYIDGNPPPTANTASQADALNSGSSQTWLLGQTIVNVHTVAEDQVQVIVSRPTGFIITTCRVDEAVALATREASANYPSLPDYLVASRVDGDAAASPLVGRLVPKEPKFERALRGIDNTPVIDTFKIAVLYVAPGQKSETEILGNTTGSALYLDFLSNLGRLIKLRGQTDVYTGGLDREADADGTEAYAWWDDLAQMVFHTPTMMPNVPHEPEHANKKRLVGNDFVKIVYNESGTDFAFDTIRTAFNFVNIVVSPHATGDGTALPGAPPLNAIGPVGLDDEWTHHGEDFFKVIVQRAPGIPDFGPIGEHKLVSRATLPTLVRQIAHHANDMAARFMHIRQAADADQAEYITSWRSRLQAINRIRDWSVLRGAATLTVRLPPVDSAKKHDGTDETLAGFSKLFPSSA